MHIVSSVWVDCYIFTDDLFGVLARIIKEFNFEKSGEMKTIRKTNEWIKKKYEISWKHIRKKVNAIWWLKSTNSESSNKHPTIFYTEFQNKTRKESGEN